MELIKLLRLHDACHMPEAGFPDIFRYIYKLLICRGWVRRCWCWRPEQGREYVQEDCVLRDVGSRAV